MIFAVKKVSNDFQRNMNDMHDKMNQQQSQQTSPPKKKNLDNEGEYVDYEEIK